MYNKIRIIRKKMSLSQRELAKLSGVSQTHITNLENGTRVPTITTARKIASALNTTVDDLFPRD